MLPRLLSAVFLSFLSLLLPCASAQQEVHSFADSSAATAFREVTFENAAALFKQDQQSLAHSLQQQDPAWVSRQTPTQLSRYVEDRVLELYKDRGYWRAKVSAQVTWVRGAGLQRQVDVVITAENEGEQYSLKEMHWNGVTAFPQSELQRMIGIRPFDLMSRSKLMAGLESIRRLYLAHGYIAYSAEPQTDFDDAAHNVVLAINVREDSAFRFGTLSVDGLDIDGSRKLQQAWGQIHSQLYSPEKLRSFFEKFLPGVPANADPLDYSHSSIDLDTHTVDIFISVLPAQAEKSN